MSQGDLTGKMVLVVEDDYLQARTIADALAEHGAIIVGPFSTVDEAVPSCESGLVDAAVLDIKIGENTSLPIADRLLSENVPFIFLTGYDRTIIPSRFKHVPHYLKPFVDSDAPTALVLAMADARVRPNRHRLQSGTAPPPSP
jgi:two-component SAPR family response regulator